MKDKLSLFTVLIVAALCLAIPSRLRAQDSDSQSGSNVQPSQGQGGGITIEPQPALPPGHPSIDSDTTNAKPEAGQPELGGSSAAQNDPNQVPTPVNRASHLLGMTVKNPQNQTVGKIRDVVFDLKTGRVAYVVLAKAKSNRGTGSDLAVPLSAFTPSADRQNLVLNADRSRVQAASGFSGNNLPSMNNPAFGGQPEQPVRREILIVPVPMGRDSESPHGPDESSPDSDQSPKMDNP